MTDQKIPNFEKNQNFLQGSPTFLTEISKRKTSLSFAFSHVLAVFWDPLGKTERIV